MTHTTEQERAQALAEKHGATSYRNRADTQNPAYGFTPIQLAALIAEVEQAARRAPAVPQFSQVAQKKLDYLLEAAEAVFEADKRMWLSGPTYADLHEDDKQRCRAMAAAALAAAPQPPEAAPVPQGWKLVPIEPSVEQINAAHAKGFFRQLAIPLYDAMLAVAPQPPEAQASVSNGTLAAPVQLPEPVAWSLGCQTMFGEVDWKLSWSKSGAGVCHRLSGKEFEHPLYTEQQVRELLAAHGIEEPQ